MIRNYSRRIAFLGAVVAILTLVIACGASEQQAAPQGKSAPQQPAAAAAKSSSSLGTYVVVALVIGLAVFGWQWSKNKVIDRQAKAEKKSLGASERVVQAAERMGRAPDKARAAVAAMNASTQRNVNNVNRRMLNPGGDSAQRAADIEKQLKAAQQFQ